MTVGAVSNNDLVEQMGETLVNKYRELGFISTLHQRLMLTQIQKIQS